MVDLPAGSVTFLFTDIEGSTALLQDVGKNVYAEMLGRHRDLVRAALTAHQGVEVGCEGDSFFVAYHQAASAVETAALAQRALAEADWPAGHSLSVRMGIHTGEPLVVGSNYVGIDVHRAARVMAAAHGGQVLVSQTTAALAKEGL